MATTFDNPDYLHLKSLSDMLKNTILWATAADAQVQVLLAKRAPVLAARIPSGVSIPEALVAASVPETVHLVQQPAAPASTVGTFRIVNGVPVSMHKDLKIIKERKTSDLPPKSEVGPAALAVGIPQAVLDKPDYLNGKHKPSQDGIKKTLALIEHAKAEIAKGNDPCFLWV